MSQTNFLVSRRVVPGVFSALMFLAAAGLAGAQQITVTPFHKSGIYDLGEKAGWNVSLPQGTTPPSNSYSYTLQKDRMVNVSSGSLDLSSGKTTIEAVIDEPCMLYLRINPAGGAGGRGQGGGAMRGGRGGGALEFGAAVAPTKIQPSVPRPADFDEFWQSKLKELAKIPANPVVTPITTTNRPGVEFYKIELDSLNSHVHGYLAKPAKEGKFPAIVYFQYAGVYALDPNIALDRAAQGWLILDVDSHDLDPAARTGVSSSYQGLGNTNRESSYFLNMYLRDVRAVDYLTSRPEWNGKTLVAMGISMGGQQSLATAGLDPRITHLIVEVPSGSDFDGPLHGRAAGYPNWSPNDARVAQTGLYFDTVNFAPHINATCFIAMGFHDTTASPVGTWATFNQIKGVKEMGCMVDAGHNHVSSAESQMPWTDGSRKWLDALVKGQAVSPNPDTVKP